MKLSKVGLSDAEWQLAFGADFILTKNRIIDEVYQVFGELASSYQQLAKPLSVRFPEVHAHAPKISRGEKYREMPWVMLDFPRSFNDANGHLAIRTFFWWGNFFSIQLHVSGRYLQQILASVPGLAADGWMVGLTQQPWDYQLPNDGWIDLENWEEGHASQNEWYLKAAKKIPIERWAECYSFLESGFSELVEMLHKTA